MPANRTGPDNRKGAFTLLEVMIAVAITALITLSIYRFIQLHLVAISTASKHNSELTTMEALLGTITADLSSLPSSQAQVNAFLGEAHKFNGLPADELHWISGAGNALFTTQASGDYKITLRLEPMKGERTSTLGLTRVPLLNEKDGEPNWLPLVPRISAMEIRYFDAAQNAWLEKWSDPRGRPALVRLRLWPQGEEDPHEAIIPVARAVAAIGVSGGNAVLSGQTGTDQSGNRVGVPVPGRTLLPVPGRPGLQSGPRR